MFLKQNSGAKERKMVRQSLQNVSFGRSGVVKMSCASYGGEERNLRGFSGGALVSSAPT